VPKFDDHILQARKNLNFLKIINQTATDHPDWQVTVCFYTALHLVNAHLSHFGLQYRNHTDVRDFINPFRLASVGKIPEDEYTAYESMFALSRRARYLVNTKDDKLKTDDAALTYEVHLAKSIRHLERLCNYFDKKYALGLDKIPIRCSNLKNKSEFTFFDLIV
jgi:hypothetical protein